MVLRPIVALGLLPAAFWPQLLAAQVNAEEALANSHRRYSLPNCDSAESTDEIVVCASDPTEFRLPIRVEPEVRLEHLPGEMPRPSNDMAPHRPCGVFQGQRRCGIKELREYGYGGGSVPLRVLIMLAKKAVNPDTELGPPGGYPIDPKTGK